MIVRPVSSFSRKYIIFTFVINLFFSSVAGALESVNISDTEPLNGIWGSTEGVFAVGGFVKLMANFSK